MDLLFPECSVSEAVVCAQSLVCHNEIPVSWLKLEFYQSPVLPLQTARLSGESSPRCLLGFGEPALQIRGLGSRLLCCFCLSIALIPGFMDTASLDSVIQDASCFKCR